MAKRPPRDPVCTWCDGYGCVICGQRMHGDKSAPPPETPPAGAVVFPVDPSDGLDLQMVFHLVGWDAIVKAFGPHGGGWDEIRWNIGVAAALKAAREKRRAGGRDIRDLIGGHHNGR